MTTIKTPNRAADLMDKIAEQIIDSILAGIASGKWTKPWNAREGLATNAITKKQYSGGNLLYLWMMEEDQGYKHGLWATYKQWESIEAQVRKGEHGIQLVKWNTKICKDHAPDERCHQCGRMFPSVFTVFNADQVDGFDAPSLDEVLSGDQRIAGAEAFFAEQGSIIRHTTEGRAYFRPSTDEITMPLFEVFHSPEAYYGTLGHEHIHWTGAKARLDRDLDTKFGSDGYAMEELIAELGAAMLCGHLGIVDTPRTDHAEYLSHWARILGADSKALWTAASKASAAVQFLISKTTKEA